MDAHQQSSDQKFGAEQQSTAGPDNTEDAENLTEKLHNSKPGGQSHSSPQQQHSTEAKTMSSSVDSGVHEMSNCDQLSRKTIVSKNSSGSGEIGVGAKPKSSQTNQLNTLPYERNVSRRPRRDRSKKNHGGNHSLIPSGVPATETEDSRHDLDTDTNPIPEASPMPCFAEITNGPGEFIDLSIVYDKADYDPVHEHLIPWLHDVLDKFNVKQYRIVCYDDEIFPPHNFECMEKIIAKSMIILIYLTKNFNNKEMTNLANAAVNGTRLMNPREVLQYVYKQREWAVRPVHTQPDHTRNYKTPICLKGVSGIDFYQQTSMTRTVTKTVQLIQEAMKHRHTAELNFRQENGQNGNGQHESRQDLYPIASLSLPSNVEGKRENQEQQGRSTENGRNSTSKSRQQNMKNHASPNSSDMDEKCGNRLLLSNSSDIVPVPASSLEYNQQRGGSVLNDGVKESIQSTDNQASPPCQPNDKLSVGNSRDSVLDNEERGRSPIPTGFQERIPTTENEASPSYQQSDQFSVGNSSDYVRDRGKRDESPFPSGVQESHPTINNQASISCQPNDKLPSGDSGNSVQGREERGRSPIPTGFQERIPTTDNKASPSYQPNDRLSVGNSRDSVRDSEQRGGRIIPSGFKENIPRPEIQGDLEEKNEDLDTDAQISLGTEVVKETKVKHADDVETKSPHTNWSKHVSNEVREHTLTHYGQPVKATARCASATENQESEKNQTCHENPAVNSNDTNERVITRKEMVTINISGCGVVQFGDGASVITERVNTYDQSNQREEEVMGNLQGRQSGSIQNRTTESQNNLSLDAVNTLHSAPNIPVSLDNSDENTAKLLYQEHEEKQNSLEESSDEDNAVATPENGDRTAGDDILDDTLTSRFEPENWTTPDKQDKTADEDILDDMLTSRLLPESWTAPDKQDETAADDLLDDTLTSRLPPESWTAPDKQESAYNHHISGVSHSFSQPAIYSMSQQHLGIVRKAKICPVNMLKLACEKCLSTQSGNVFNADSDVD